VERDARFSENMLVVKGEDLVPSDLRFKYQDKEARRYRATIARMMHFYDEQCGSWTEYPGYHSFVRSVRPLTELDQRVLAAHLDKTICDILEVANPSQNRTEGSALREATQLKKQQCMQSLYVAMAKAARARDSKVESLFLSLATEQAIDDSTESNDDHLDMLESITPQLRPMLKDFKLNDKAQTICRSVERMTAEEYHIPPSGRFQVHPVTGVAGKPFWWDLFGHFNLKSFAIAQSLVNKLGRFQLNHDFGVSMDQVIDDIMLILCPLVRYYSGGRSYDSRRQQLMTTLDLDEEVHHITRYFMHHRAYKSIST